MQPVSYLSLITVRLLNTALKTANSIAKQHKNLLDLYEDFFLHRGKSSNSTFKLK